MTMLAGPLSVWSVAAIIAWLVVVVTVWLLFLAYGRSQRSSV